jgi:hypothetical protein
VNPRGARRTPVALWTVRLLDSGHEVGKVAATTYEEALGRAIALAARTGLAPQCLDLQKAE